jgi:hypothetical protein
MSTSNAVEHARLVKLILSNVSNRKWDKAQLESALDRLYLMGYRHFLIDVGNLKPVVEKRE